MKNLQNVDHSNEELARRCALLEEKNRELIARVLSLSEENRSNDALIRVLLENTPFGILLFDDKRRVIQINKAAENLLKIERVNIIGKSCEFIFNCFSHNQSCPVLDDNQSLDRLETDCRSDMCQCNSYLLRSAVKIETNNGTVLVEAFVDITPIKQAQLEIENANKTKDNFLSKVSHELRTPLNAIVGFAELLQDSFKDRPDQDESIYLGNILSSSKTLLRMVDEVLDITRLTANRLKLDEYEIDIAGLVQQLGNELSERCLAQQNKLHIQCAEDIGILVVDPVRLHQILFHLLDNACKFTHQGDIHLTVSRKCNDEADWITFSIKDTGEGMDEETLVRIFHEFEQADDGHTRRHGGAGLGLTLCKAISTLMGGEIQVSSKLGTGSEFVLLLPLKETID